MVNLEEEKISGLLSGWGLATRTCDNCTSCSALLYCGAHRAFLCGACDSTLHRALRHERVWICEVCEQAPAAVTCKADAAALCTSCDRDIHSANPLAARHERVAVIPFLDTPATCSGGLTEAATVDTWLIPNPDFLNYGQGSDLLDFKHEFVNNYGNNEINYNNTTNKTNYINQTFVVSDSVVPSQSNGNLSSLQQNSFDIDFSQPTKHFEVMSSFNFASQQPTVSLSDIGVVPEGTNTNNSTSEVSYTFTKSGGTADVASSGTTAPVMDREARVMRYREKRKNRKFEKTIRYASRKAYAETRPRVKGRFAKRTDKSSDTSSEFDPIYLSGSGGFMLDQGGYSVVPTF